jgi:hypothetical protein
MDHKTHDKLSSNMISKVRISKRGQSFQQWKHQHMQAKRYFPPFATIQNALFRFSVPQNHSLSEEEARIVDSVSVAGMPRAGFVQAAQTLRRRATPGGLDFIPDCSLA